MNEKVQSLLREIVVVNNDRMALELSLNFGKRSTEAQRQHFGGDFKHGFFYLVRDDNVSTDTVMECVTSLDGGDAVTSLYKNHSALATVGELMRTRQMLADALAQKVGLSVEAIGIDDQARGRSLGVNELSTGQLIDMLAEKLGMSVLKTDNHAIEAPKIALQ